MNTIHIPQLTRAPQQTEVINFSETVPGLETLTPVQGQLKVTHQGSYLDVSAKAETIVTLMCHRCLQQYNHRLSIEPSELIWLDETTDGVEPVLLDRDIAPEDLIETLSSKGDFDPTTWLYEQLCLEIPQRQLCDQACKGIVLETIDSTPPAVDRRWASLKTLKDQLHH